MESIPAATWTVEQMLKTYPQTVSVFLALRTDCAGCALERFCTLTEVAASYELPLDILLQKLCESAKQGYISRCPVI
jgi:hybrid cluster-associated redox disulfide protein